MNPALWTAPFRFGGHLHRPLLAVFLAINLLVATNAVIHNSAVGYDADAHLDYVTTVASGQLPSRDQSPEFYAPPLPYAVPATLGLVGVTDTQTLGKAAQLVNVAYGLVLTFFLVKLCRRLKPHDPRFATWTLLLLGMLPVFYRTMAFVRGEALCAALAMVLADRLLATGAEGDASASPVQLGVLGGLLLLAKEWGAFVVAAMVVFLLLRGYARRAAWTPLLRAVGTTVVVATLVGGWFYPYLFVRFGSPATYSERDTQWALNHRPAAFFTGTGMDQLFTAPVRNHFSQPTQLLLPIVYSDTWGDYWCYWLANWQEDPPQVISPAAVYLRDAAPPTEILPYLARLNLAGVLPTALYGGGLALGLLAVLAMLRRRAESGQGAAAWCAIAVVVPLAGFTLLLMWVPTMDVKASYLLHVFPFAAILTAAFLGLLRDRWPGVAMAVDGLLLLAIAHHAPALLSRFSILT